MIIKFTNNNILTSRSVDGCVRIECFSMGRASLKSRNQRDDAIDVLNLDDDLIILFVNKFLLLVVVVGRIVSFSLLFLSLCRQTTYCLISNMYTSIHILDAAYWLP